MQLVPFHRELRETAEAGTGMEIERLDHLVLTVRDMSASIDFYTRVLGMELVTFQGNRKAVRFGQQKINLHALDEQVDAKAQHPTPGSADLCFVVDGPLDGVVRHLQDHGVQITQGPVSRSGALGTMQSIYFRDPDGNLIELSTYD